MPAKRLRPSPSVTILWLLLVGTPGMFTIDEQFDAAVHQATALQAVTFA
jgi:hypothetical protein